MGTKIGDGAQKVLGLYSPLQRFRREMSVLCVIGGLQLPGEDGAGTSLLHSLASELCRVITRQLVMLDVISLANLMEWEALV